MRRKFFDLHARDNSPSTSAVVKTMAPLRAIKDRICRHGAEGAPASGQNAPPRSWLSCSPCWNESCRGVSGNSKLAEIMRYVLSRRAALERFLADGPI